MLKSKLQPFIDRYNEITAELSTPEIASDITKMTELSKEQSNLEPIVNKAKEIIEVAEAIEENKQMLGDPDFGDLAKEELAHLEPRLKELEEEIKILMIPKDPNDDKNIYLELRAGTGGDESALFVEDAFRMYSRYADKLGWKVEIVSSSEGTAGGYKELIILIKGESVYSKLKFEAGTHRVQRVPATETQGRVHTSAITVAVIPEVDDVEVDIKPNEIKMDVYRSSGCGGQSVNTTDSAVRLTHIPTGIVAQCQDQKSQHKNKDKAFKVLRSRIYEMELQKKLEADSAKRNSLVASGDRSAKIRTYNYAQGRVTDHRIGLTLYDLSNIINGDIHKIVEALELAENTEKLKEMNEL